MHEGLFSRRKLEIFFAGQTLFYGVWIMMPWHSMSSDGFTFILQEVDEYRWGTMFFFNGLSHVLALLINGHRWWSPFVRWFAAMVSMLLYAAIAISFAHDDWTSTGVVNYVMLSLGACICLYTAWLDAKIAMRIRNVARYA